MRPSRELIAGTTSAEALQSAGNVVHAFLSTLANGTQDPTRMQELHVALLALDPDARNTQYAEVMRALESAQPVRTEQAATGDAVAQLLQEQPQESSAPSALQTLSPKVQRVMRLLQAIFAAEELPSAAFFKRCEAAGMQAFALATLQRHRLGMEDGALFQAISDAYTLEFRNPPSRKSLQARLRILDVAAAMYDQRDDQRNVTWVNGQILAFGGRLFGPEDGSQPPSNNKALCQATEAIEQRLRREPESPALIAELCEEMERVWQAYGITGHGCQRKSC